ncbi:aldo/keto reductase [Hymenobacter sp. HDW8]|uniref:aldo/keto reductase n=1 Tax=Hymenobacter sp. HDW8 TaxID=2714932 RepID=UPI001408861A|nr:aldo/keto reductase [Hymenobacter sp. HDW8]QIL77819.1 aldo/keto reductase [Hymenobacter sp. HDW8]
MIDVPFVQRLALGTAQFGLAYGINNNVGKPASAIVAEILLEAANAGITTLDTAAAYGDSETVIGTELAAHALTFELITKVGAAPRPNVTRQIDDSLARLRQSTIHGVLFHSFTALQQHPDAYDALLDARASGRIKCVGVSLYHPWEAEWLLDKGWPLDIVQVPFNALDQRFAPLMPELAHQGIQVHARSAFLQGLLLRQPATVPPFFEPLRPKLELLHRIANEIQVPLAAALLLFAAYTPGVARVVIGVDSRVNLRENLAAAQYVYAVKTLYAAFQPLAENSDSFILPYTWPPR